MEYRRHDQKHRLNGPAVITENDGKHYFQYGVKLYVPNL